MTTTIGVAGIRRAATTRSSFLQNVSRRHTRERSMKKEQIRELLLQALETEMGGVEVYTKALECVANDDLRMEWTEYLDQTKNHVRVVRDLCGRLGIDPDEQTPGRKAVGTIGKSLVSAMTVAQEEAEGAQLVAGECVVLAETKDHLNWELLAEVAKELDGVAKQAVEDACDGVEEEEDEHLYHSQGWTRELWLEALGLPAVLPPPEEEKDVKTAIGAERAKQQREELL
jgi:rubrerythrin